MFRKVNLSSVLLLFEQLDVVKKLWFDRCFAEVILTCYLTNDCGKDFGNMNRDGLPFEDFLNY